DRSFCIAQLQRDIGNTLNILT
ncbi:hypothetical protein D047_1497B, partial [Vibrio parahaemolyticus VPTS-2010_2]